MNDINEFLGESLIGKVFDQWTVIGYSGKRGYNTMWLCRCSCGTERHVAGGNLKNGKSTSCGHWKKTHGMFGSPEYHIWEGMRTRCKPGHEYYERGIRVCDRWTSFAKFFEDVGPRPSKDHSIDRIDNNGNYEPSNVRWATPKIQGRNKRNNRFITYQGQKMCVSAFAERMGIPAMRIFRKLASGLSEQDVVSWAETHSNAISKAACVGLDALAVGNFEDAQKQFELILDLA